MAARSLEKEIRERNHKHSSSNQAPERSALEKYQDAKKRSNCIEHVTSGGDEKSSCRGFYRATPPHRCARTRIDWKQRANHVTSHSSNTNQKEQKPNRPGSNQDVLGSKAVRANSAAVSLPNNPTHRNRHEKAKPDQKQEYLPITLVNKKRRNILVLFRINKRIDKIPSEHSDIDGQRDRKAVSVQ